MALAVAFLRVFAERFQARVQCGLHAALFRLQLLICLLQSRLFVSMLCQACSLAASFSSKAGNPSSNRTSDRAYGAANPADRCVSVSLNGQLRRLASQAIEFGLGGLAGMLRLHDLTFGRSNRPSCCAFLTVQPAQLVLKARSLVDDVLQGLDRLLFLIRSWNLAAGIGMVQRAAEGQASPSRRRLRWSSRSAMVLSSARVLSRAVRSCWYSRSRRPSSKRFRSPASACVFLFERFCGRLQALRGLHSFLSLLFCQLQALFRRSDIYLLLIARSCSAWTSAAWLRMTPNWAISPLSAACVSRYCRTCSWSFAIFSRFAPIVFRCS